MRISQIVCYPVKSCRGNVLSEAQVGARGLAHDRRWLVIEENGHFITGRSHPALVLLDVQTNAAGLLLSAPGMSPVQVDQPSDNASKVAIEIWRDKTTGVDAGDAAAKWLSQYLKQPVRLVYQSDSCLRRIDRDFASQGETVSYADGYPLLLISQAALDQLNSKLATPISMARFRPNIVIADSKAHVEDSWQRIRVGEVEFDLIKACTRCVFTTVDPITGLRGEDGEPLATLKTYRRSDAGVTFGQNLIPRGTGIIKLADEIDIDPN